MLPVELRRVRVLVVDNRRGSAEPVAVVLARGIRGVAARGADELPAVGSWCLSGVGAAAAALVVDLCGIPLAHLLQQ